MRCTWLGIRHHAHTSTSAARQCSAEQIAVERVVGVAEEGARAAVAALGDVVRQAGNDDAGETGHARIMAATQATRQLSALSP